MPTVSGQGGVVYQSLMTQEAPLTAPVPTLNLNSVAHLDGVQSDRGTRRPGRPGLGRVPATSRISQPASRLGKAAGGRGRARRSWGISEALLGGHCSDNTPHPTRQIGPTKPSTGQPRSSPRVTSGGFHRSNKCKSVKISTHKNTVKVFHDQTAKARNSSYSHVQSSIPRTSPRARTFKPKTTAHDTSVLNDLKSSIPFNPLDDVDAAIPLSAAKHMETLQIGENLRELRMAFEGADKDKSNMVDEEEFVARAKERSPEKTEEELRKTFMLIDANGDGAISWDEYIEFTITSDAQKQATSETKTKNMFFPQPSSVVSGKIADEGTKKLVCGVNGNKYITISVVGTLTSFHASSLMKGKCLKQYIGQYSAAVDIPKHNRLIVASLTRSIWCYDMFTLEREAMFTVETVPMCFEFFQYKGQDYLAYGDDNGYINISTNFRVPLSRITFNSYKAHDDWVTGLRYIEKTHTLVSSSLDKTIKRFDMLGEHFVGALDVGKGVLCVEWLEAAKYICVSGVSGVIDLWTAHGTAPIASLIGHTGPVRSIISLDNFNQIVSFSDDKTVRIWDLQTFTSIQTLRSDKEDKPLESLMYDAKRGRLVTSTAEDLKYWPASNFLSAEQVDSSDKPLVGICACSEFDVVASADIDSKVCVWSLNSGRLQCTFQENDNDLSVALTDLCFDASGRRLITVNRSGTIRTWNYTTGQMIREIETGGNEATCVIQVEQGLTRNIVVSCWNDELYVVQDINEKSRRPTVTKLSGHGADISCVRWNPPAVLASSAYNGTLCMWNLQSLQRMQYMTIPDMDTKEPDQLHIQKVTFLPKKKGLLVGCTEDGVIYIWNAKRALLIKEISLRRSLSIPGSPITCIETDSANQYLACGTEDGKVRIFDITSISGDESTEVNRKLPCSEFEAHKKSLVGMSFVKGAWLLTASSDCNLVIWDLSGKQVGRLGTKAWEFYHLSKDGVQPQFPKESTDVETHLEGESDDMHNRKVDLSKQKSLSMVDEDSDEEIDPSNALEKLQSADGQYSDEAGLYNTLSHLPTKCGQWVSKQENWEVSRSRINSVLYAPPCFEPNSATYAPSHPRVSRHTACHSFLPVPREQTEDDEMMERAAHEKRFYEHLEEEFGKIEVTALPSPDKERHMRFRGRKDPLQRINPDLQNPLSPPIHSGGGPGSPRSAIREVLEGNRERSPSPTGYISSPSPRASRSPSPLRSKWSKERKESKPQSVLGEHEGTETFDDIAEDFDSTWTIRTPAEGMDEDEATEDSGGLTDYSIHAQSPRQLRTHRQDRQSHGSRRPRSAMSRRMTPMEGQGAVGARSETRRDGDTKRRPVSAAVTIGRRIEENIMSHPHDSQLEEDEDSDFTLGVIEDDADNDGNVDPFEVAGRPPDDRKGGTYARPTSSNASLSRPPSAVGNRSSRSTSASQKVILPVASRTDETEEDHADRLSHLPNEAVDGDVIVTERLEEDIGFDEHLGCGIDGWREDEKPPGDKSNTASREDHCEEQREQGRKQKQRPVTPSSLSGKKGRHVTSAGSKSSAAENERERTKQIIALHKQLKQQNPSEGHSAVVIPGTREESHETRGTTVKTRPFSASDVVAYSRPVIAATGSPEGEGGQLQRGVRNDVRDFGPPGTTSDHLGLVTYIHPTNYNARLTTGSSVNPQLGGRGRGLGGRGAPPPAFERERPHTALPSTRTHSTTPRSGSTFVDPRTPRRPVSSATFKREREEQRQPPQKIIDPFPFSSQYRPESAKRFSASSHLSVRPSNSGRVKYVPPEKCRHRSIAR